MLSNSLPFLVYLGGRIGVITFSTASASLLRPWSTAFHLNAGQHESPLRLSQQKESRHYQLHRRPGRFGHNHASFSSYSSWYPFPSSPSSSSACRSGCRSRKISRPSSFTTLATSSVSESITASVTTTNEVDESYHTPVMSRECIDALFGRSHTLSSTKKRKNKYAKYAKKGRGQNNNFDTDMYVETGERAIASSSVAASPTSIITDKTLGRKKPQIFVDATLGGGGHSHRLLRELDGGDVLVGCDVDPSALATASRRLSEYMVVIPNEEQINDDKNSILGGDDGGYDDDFIGMEEKPIFIPVQSNFRDLAEVISKLKHPVTGQVLVCLPGNGNNLNNNGNNDKDGSIVGNGTFIGVDGILMDLGVSSHQIDTPGRGFSYSKGGPLDMRMAAGGGDSDKNKTLCSVGGLTAADVCNNFDHSELRRIFRTYGDEPRAHKISEAIIERRPLRTTDDLVDAVAAVTPEFAKKGRRLGRTATLARVFQSLRIVVNEEDSALEDALLDMAPSLTRPNGGRLVCLTYHSMEDRAVKRAMRDGSITGRRRVLKKDMYGNVDRQDLPWMTLGKRIGATTEEVEANPRARSATLRVAERS